MCSSICLVGTLLLAACQDYSIYGLDSSKYPYGYVDTGRRADMEAGMSKLFASEMAAKVTLDAIRIHGGHGYSKEFDVERFYRDAPLMIVGEGTNEILRGVIAKQAVGRRTLF